MANKLDPGIAATIPSEIKGWNWGAFCLTWIWGLGNRTYIALLALLPGVSIVMAVILGAKGNQWAWANKQWDSLNHFRDVQRRWKLWGLTALGWQLIIAAIIILPERFGISNPTGIIFVLAGNAAFWFFMEKSTRSNLFNFVPPLMFIYILSAVFSNSGLIPADSPVYDWMGEAILPFFLVLLLLDVDVKATIKVMGRGVFVMLIGTAGVVIGAPVGYFLVKGWLDPEAWKGFGALAGSWIGGTGNMAAVSEGLGTSGTHFGLAVIADNAVYLVWLPLLLQSKNLANWFHKFTRVTSEQLDKLKTAADELVVEKGKLEMRHILYLIGIGFGVTYLAILIAGLLPELPPVLTKSTYKVLLVTTMGLALSFSPAKKIPGSHELAMAFVYLFVARMGARAVVSGLAGQAVPFVAGAFVWIFIHGAFILLAARIFRIDVHTAAISSAANIGAAASAPVVAAYHDERLVPVSILMALIGYAVGNYAAFFAAYLCSLVA